MIKCECLTYWDSHHPECPTGLGKSALPSPGAQPPSEEALQEAIAASTEIHKLRCGLATHTHPQNGCQFEIAYDAQIIQRAINRSLAERTSAVAPQTRFDIYPWLNETMKKSGWNVGRLIQACEEAGWLEDLADTILACGSAVAPGMSASELGKQFCAGMIDNLKRSGADRAAAPVEVPRDQWISIEEKLPEVERVNDPHPKRAINSDPVLIRRSINCYLSHSRQDENEYDLMVACFCTMNNSDSSWWELVRPGSETDRIPTREVTHWMPLPQARAASGNPSKGHQD